MQATLRYKGSHMGSVYFSIGVRAHLDGKRVESGEGKDHILRYGDVLFCKGLFYMYTEVPKYGSHFVQKYLFEMGSFCD